MNLQNRHGFAPFENSSATVNWDTGGFFAETVDIGKLMKRKSPEANLRLQYKKTFELSLIFTLGILIATFQVARQFSLAPSELKNANVTIEVADIPPTEQIRNLPTPPARPAVPVPTESELVPEDITIQSTNLDLSELPPPPAPPVEHRYEQYNFIPYDEAPEPIGGYGVILANLEYPSIAQKAGIEARVVVGVLIDERGNCVKTQILSTTNEMMGFDEAAQKAVMAVKWKPAKQRDMAVKVWVSIPVRFSLKEIQT